MEESTSSRSALNIFYLRDTWDEYPGCNDFCLCGKTWDPKDINPKEMKIETLPNGCIRLRFFESEGRRKMREGRQKSRGLRRKRQNKLIDSWNREDDFEGLKNLFE